MKIAFIGGRDIHTLGGIENYMCNLAAELAERGHEPVVYCESDRDDVEWVNGFKVIHQKSVGGRYLCKILLSFRATVNALHSRSCVEVYHYNAWPPSLASWIPRLFGRTALLQGHGFEWRHSKYSPTQKKILKFMEWLTAKINRNIILVSQEQTDYFRENYGKECTTVPTATHLPESSENKDVLKKFGLAPEGYFLFLGRLAKVKNPDYLISAFMKSGISGKKLVLAGNNDAEPDYVHRLHELARGNENIIFTGAVYGDDKNALLENCFAFCIPSTSEGLSIALLEAMSFGRICIASDIAPNRECLGESGVLCRYEDSDDLAEKMVFVSENYDSLKWQEAYNSRRVSENFTWSAVADKYIAYLNEIHR